MKITIVIVSVVAIIGVFLASLFFVQTQLLTAELQEFKVRLDAAEQSIIILQDKNSQFEAFCKGNEELAREFEAGRATIDVENLETISKVCGFTWCNPQYCHDEPVLPTNLCQEAKDALSQYVNQFHTFVECSQDADCEAYYVLVGSCVPPVVLSKANFAKVLEEGTTEYIKLLELQDEVRDACADEFASQPACGPILVNPVCTLEGCLSQEEAAVR